MPEAFAEENFVVISSTIPITMRKWRLHLEKNWEKLMKENTRLLVVAGVHGGEDGRLGRNEDKGRSPQICTVRDSVTSQTNKKNPSFFGIIFFTIL